jgi:hypothetical protein
VVIFKELKRWHENGIIGETYTTTNQLSNDCVLATYKLIEHNKINEKKKYSLRSSIWKCFDGRWKMFFHQGTLTSEF